MALLESRPGLEPLASLVGGVVSRELGALAGEASLMVMGLWLGVVLVVAASLMVMGL